MKVDTADQQYVETNFGFLRKGPKVTWIISTRMVRKLLPSKVRPNADRRTAQQVKVVKLRN